MVTFSRYPLIESTRGHHVPAGERKRVQRREIRYPGYRCSPLILNREIGRNDANGINGDKMMYRSTELRYLIDHIDIPSVRTKKTDKQKRDGRRFSYFRKIKLEIYPERSAENVSRGFQTRQRTSETFQDVGEIRFFPRKARRGDSLVVTLTFVVCQEKLN